MLIIFGVGEREVSLATLLFACETCGNRAAHHLFKRVRKVSLFFIPLIPLGTRYYDLCTACGRTLEVSRSQAQAASQTQPDLR